MNCFISRSISIMVNILLGQTVLLKQLTDKQIIRLHNLVLETILTHSTPDPNKEVRGEDWRRICRHRNSKRASAPSTIIYCDVLVTSQLTVIFNCFEQLTRQCSNKCFGQSSNNLPNTIVFAQYMTFFHPKTIQLGNPLSASHQGLHPLMTVYCLFLYN